MPTRTNRNITPVGSNGESLSRSNTTTTIKPEHSNHSSIASSLNGYLASNSGGESSNGMSPADGPMGRFNGGQGLASLPESRNSRLQTSDAVEASKRLVQILLGLHHSLVPVGHSLERDSPKRNAVERKLFDANGQLDELDRLLDRIANNLEIGTKREKAAFRDVVVFSLAALKSYAGIVATLRRHVQPSVPGQGAMHLRELMTRAYYCIAEARNVCKFLGMSIKAVDTRSRSSKAWSSRTVTPTQVKPVSGRRIRAATIRQDSTSFQRSKPPPVSLNPSRSNTMTSMPTATPRSGESYVSSRSPSSTAAPSRTHTVQTISNEEETEQFERIFLKLRHATDTAAHALSQCHSEFNYRKEHAESLGQMHAASQWALTLTKCDSVTIANAALMNRLSVIKLNDPLVRNQRDFWSHCDSFVQVRQTHDISLGP